MMKRILFCVLCLYAAAAAAEPPVILVMGDSLCAAFGIKVSDGWVTLLQQRLEQRGYDYNVVNACVSGETTAGGLSRLPGELKRHAPAIVVLELGANDGLRGTSLEPVKDNLGQMLALSSKSGAKILLLGVELPPNYGPEYTGRFRAM
jgi:acyl-CoA thioesterase-1